MRLPPNRRRWPVFVRQSHDGYFRVLRPRYGQILHQDSRPSILDSALNIEATQILPSSVIELGQFHRLHLFSRRELPTRDSSLLSVCGEVAEIATPPPLVFHHAHSPFLNSSAMLDFQPPTTLNSFQSSRFHHLAR